MENIAYNEHTNVNMENIAYNEHTNVNMENIAYNEHKCKYGTLHIMNIQM